jgi:hypothetical protein
MMTNKNKMLLDVAEGNFAFIKKQQKVLFVILFIDRELEREI